MDGGLVSVTGAHEIASKLVIFFRTVIEILNF